MSRTLTVLLNDDDLAVVASLRPEALAGDVIAFDLDVHLSLLTRGIAHSTPFDHVGPDEFEALRHFDTLIHDHWEQHAHAHYKGIDLLALARYRHVTALRRLSWVIYATERILDERRPDVVVTFDEPLGHGLHQPPGSNQMPLLFAALRGAAERRGIDLDLLARGDADGELWIDHAACASSAHEGNTEADLPEEPWVLCYGDGSDIARQQPLICRLRAEGLTVVQAYSAASAADLAAAKTHGPRPVHVSRFGAAVPDERLVRETQRLARSTFDASRANAHTDLAPWLANRHLDIHLDFVFGSYLEAMARQVERWTSVFSQRPPALVISPSPVPLVDLAAAAGVPLLHTAHGLMTLGEPDYFSLLHGGTIGAIGPLHAQLLIES